MHGTIRPHPELTWTCIHQARKSINLTTTGRCCRRFCRITLRYISAYIKCVLSFWFRVSSGLGALVEGSLLVSLFPIPGARGALCTFFFFFFWWLCCLLFLIFFRVLGYVFRNACD
ncbi:hypothetical protein EX30DRAFT_189910 [Ascodesmis nigricans]|uniref:Uncharacterized protein n=1 Tax=Ascodesmis nigricans TaxID=341454 RepID=A0A4S2N0D7_9PEZI|nr:hypothetical protein EX30DRAFT_189910 [Ascodesmis nigricans]